MVVAAVLSVTLLAGCATSPTGRRQLQLFPEQQMAQMGTEAYGNIKQQTPASQDKAVNQYVECVADAIIRVLPEGRNKPSDWEVTVFRSDQINAFALPGGKIGVYTGLLRVAQNQAQLGAVLGHEVGHVLAHHANARLSANYATMAGLTVVSVLAGASGGQRDRQTMMALLGLGVQVGVLLPFTRSQESEADLIGLNLMARAGFKPQESIELWHQMAKASNGEPPEFLSTHPSHSTRIQDLRDHMPEAQREYEQAGRHPSCRRAVPEKVDSGKKK